MAEAEAEVPRRDVNQLSGHVLDLLTSYFSSFPNDTSDFNQPHLRRSVQHLYPLFVALYGLVAVLGTIGNLFLIVNVLRRRLHRDPTYFLLLNNAMSDLIKCLLVMPISLSNLLIANWVFGRIFCYLMPMGQHILMNVTCLTFVLIALDRYRLLVHVPYLSSSRVPRLVCAIGVWAVSFCVVLPFLVYIRYIDLRPEIDHGVCLANIDDNMEEYARGLFIALYVLPLATIAYLQVRITGEIKNRENGPLSATVCKSSRSYNNDLSVDGGSMATVVSGGGGGDTPCPTRSTWRSSGGGAPGTGNDTPSTTITTVPVSPPSSVRGAPPYRHPLQDQVGSVDKERFQSVELRWRPPVTDPRPVSEEEAVFDARRERRTQSYLVAMVTTFAVCLAPWEILRLVRILIQEDLDNTGTYDLCFLVIVLISYVPTCTTPALFACWTARGDDELSGYLQFGDRPVVLDELDVLAAPPRSNGGQRNLKLHIRKPDNY